YPELTAEEAKDYLDNKAEVDDFPSFGMKKAVDQMLAEKKSMSAPEGQMPERWVNFRKHLSEPRITRGRRAPPVKVRLSVASRCFCSYMCWAVDKPVDDTPVPTYGESLINQ
ncbi:hypothetical protein FOZ63_013279, partial [Perkinsus olseni]